MADADLGHSRGRCEFVDAVHSYSDSAEFGSFALVAREILAEPWKDSLPHCRGHILTAVSEHHFMSGDLTQGEIPWC